MNTNVIEKEEKKEVVKEPIKLEERELAKTKSSIFAQNNTEHLKDIEKLLKGEEKKEYVY